MREQWDRIRFFRKGGKIMRVQDLKISVAGKRKIRKAIQEKDIEKFIELAFQYKLSGQEAWELTAL